jgi:hypothetical protein
MIETGDGLAGSGIVIRLGLETRAVLSVISEWLGA